MVSIIVLYCFSILLLQVLQQLIFNNYVICAKVLHVALKDFGPCLISLLQVIYFWLAGLREVLLLHLFQRNSAQSPPFGSSRWLRRSKRLRECITKKCSQILLNLRTPIHFFDFIANICKKQQFWVLFVWKLETQKKIDRPFLGKCSSFSYFKERARNRLHLEDLIDSRDLRDWESALPKRSRQYTFNGRTRKLLWLPSILGKCSSFSNFKERALNCLHLADHVDSRDLRDWESILPKRSSQNTFNRRTRKLLWLSSILEKCSSFSYFKERTCDCFCLADCVDSGDLRDWEWINE